MQQCGVYYVVDNVRNFKLKVSLRRVTRGGSEADNATDEQLVAGWQEKYFSRHEENLYADANNCVSVLEQKYHRDVLQLRREGGRTNHRLYTYTNSDTVPIHVSEVHQPLLSHGQDVATFTTKYGGGVANRRNTHHASNGPLLVIPDHNERVCSRCPAPLLHHMYIMVDLSHDLSDDFDEQVLCHIVVKDNYILTMTPDITHDRPWYRVENSNREVYEYKIENVSPAISDAELHHEHQIQNKLLWERQHMNDVGEFSESIPSELRVIVLGSIISAQDFEYSDLYIMADLDLPPEWTGTNTTVCTQICHTTPTNKVFSYDHWERHRLEGYGYCHLPSSPGTYRLELATWRPATPSLMDHLTRYFIGGSSPKFSDASYISSTLNKGRLGVHGNSSGTIAISLNIIHQSHSNIPTTKAELVTTETVLELLHRTRQRLKTQ